MRCVFPSSASSPMLTYLPASIHQTVDFNHRVGMDEASQLDRRPVGKLSEHSRLCIRFSSDASVLRHRNWRSSQGSFPTWMAGMGRCTSGSLAGSGSNQSFQCFCRSFGIVTRVISTAAEAHNQLGKVEKHGHLFEVIFQKVLDQVQPVDQHEFEQCLLHTANCKNEMINSKGLSPVQHVFGRNPRIASDLLQDDPDPVAATSPLFDERAARTQAIRTAARVGVAVSQDDKSLRAAMSARPRVERDFVAGDFVSYWRTQKYMRGTRLVGGRWYGTGIVMGKIGRNVLVFHRQNMFKVSPEHLRHASESERAVAQADGRELLGITDLVAEGRNLLGNQYVDLSNQEGPPDPASVAASFQQVVEGQDEWRQEGDLLIRVHNKLRVGKFFPNMDDPFLQNVALDDWRLTKIRNSGFQVTDQPWTLDAAARVMPLRPEPWLGETCFRISSVADPATEIEGPVGSVPNSPDGAHDNAVPGRNPDVPMPESSSASGNNQQESSTGNSMSSTSYGPVRHRSRGHENSQSLIRPPLSRLDDFADVLGEITEHGSKRSHSPDEVERKSARTGTYDEVLVVEALLTEQHETVESLMASFLQKKLQNELPHSNNPPALQEKIDDAKVTEFIHTLLHEKQAIKVIPPHRARHIRRNQSHRIMSSRFVITEKKEDNSSRTKARWCLRGHHDPALAEKVLAGKCHSPTLSQLGRSVILQLLVSNRWTLNLGDIKGAFLEADISKQTSANPVYAELPPGGAPGVEVDSLVQVLGNVYGANDAPHNWYREFDSVALQAGFTRSKLDSCLYFCHGANGSLEGVLGAHVDDTITGGVGSRYDAAIAALKSRFPFRKWREGHGEFLGTYYTQHGNGEITCSQKDYAQHIRPISISKERIKKPWLPATEKEVSALRAVNGALGWIASQTRPDLSVQTSLSQQAFPSPTVQHLLAANQAVRRCRQQQDLEIRVPYIPPEELTLCFWSDAAFANSEDHKTQAGWMLAFTSKQLSNGQDVPIHCVGWKSYKLSRVVSSTLSGEAQAYATASGMAEWCLLLLAECLDGQFSLEQSAEVLKRRPPVGITDCRSLYDHLISLGSGVP